MLLDCPANVVTLADGGLACQDGNADAVAWVVQPSFDPSQLEGSQILAAFSAGFFLVAMFWGLGKGVALVLSIVRR